MLRFGDNKQPIKKRKWVGLDFSSNDPITLRHQGTKPLIIKGSIGKTLIHRIYIDNRSSINIIYSHFLAQLLETVKIFIEPATSVVVGFDGQSIWPEWKIPLPFTLVDYQDLQKMILVDFIII